MDEWWKEFGEWAERNRPWSPKYTPFEEWCKPQVPKLKRNVVFTEDLDVWTALKILIDNGFPLEFEHRMESREIHVRFDEREPAERLAALQEDYKRLEAEMVKYQDLYAGADAEALRLFAENEQLKKELQEAKEMSLF